jgi:hypothetical protein
MRSMGTDAAIMVTAASAVPQITRVTPSSGPMVSPSAHSCECGYEGNVRVNSRGKSRPPNSGREEHLIKADAAALVRLGRLSPVSRLFRGSSSQDSHAHC